MFSQDANSKIVGGLLSDKEQNQIHKAVTHAYNLKQHEIALYSKRSFFFLFVIIILAVSYFIIFFTHFTLLSHILEMVICLCGVTFAHSWYRATYNNWIWHKKWEIHLSTLQQYIRDSVYKTSLVSVKINESNQNTAYVYQIISLVILILWCALPAISLLKVFYTILFVNELSLSFRNAFFVCIPFLIMIFLSITANIGVCMFSSATQDDPDALLSSE